MYNPYIVVRLCKYLWLGEEKICTYSDFVSMAHLTIMQGDCSVLYFHVFHVWLYHIIPHYVIKGTTFRMDVIEHKMRI
jgi:hypothetical protein